MIVVRNVPTDVHVWLALHDQRVHKTLLTPCFACILVLKLYRVVCNVCLQLILMIVYSLITCGRWSLVHMTICFWKPDGPTECKRSVRNVFSVLSLLQTVLCVLILMVVYSQIGV